MTTPRNHETNTEFVTRLMDFSKHGALMHLFVIDALEKRANQILNISDEDLEAAFDRNNMIDWRAWKACAQEIKDNIEERTKL